MKNMKLTVKALLLSLLLFVFTFYLSDVLFFWLSANAFIAWPFLYNKKKSQIDDALAKLNNKIDHTINNIGFLMNIEKRAKSGSDSQNKRQL